MSKSDINILICSPGERHEDCIPKYFIPLSEENLKKVSRIILRDCGYGSDEKSKPCGYGSDGSDEKSEPCGGEYYIYVLIPGKPVLLEWLNDCDMRICFGKNNLYDYEGDISYEKFEKNIIDIYNKKLMLKGFGHH